MPGLLTIEESRRLLRVTQRLCRPMASAGLLADDALAADLTRLFNADFIGTTRWNAERRAFEGASCIGRGPEMAHEYAERFQFEDPISPQARHRRVPTLAYGIVPRDELVRTVYYREFLWPFRTVDGIDLYLYQGRHNVGDVRIWRGPARKPFGTHEVALLGLLRPYLLNAMLGLRELARPSGGDGGSIDPTAAEHCRWPCFRHDAGAGVRPANAAAEQVCRELGAAGLPDFTHRIERVARSGRPTAWDEYTLCVARGAESDGALVQLVPVLSATGAAHALEGRYGLTPREAQVCLLLAGGRTDAQIGAALGISYWTVRTHLRKVFVKFDVASRVDLARVLAAPDR